MKVIHLPLTSRWLKRCPKCGPKPRGEFHIDNHRKDGRAAYCKACISVVRAEQAKKRAAGEAAHQKPARKPADDEDDAASLCRRTIVDEARDLLAAHGWGRRRLDQASLDAVMREANRIRAANGLPQQGRKPEWLWPSR